jgi:hypothetical protein
VGLKKELTEFLTKVRLLYAATGKFYVLSNMPAGGTWVQQRDETLAAGTTWAGNDEFLSTPGISYAVRKLNGNLYVATDSGLYCRKE